MEENKNSKEHSTHWATNILCVVRRKNQQEMVRNKQFANLVLITQILGSRTECSQVYMQLYNTIFIFLKIYGLETQKYLVIIYSNLKDENILFSNYLKLIKFELRHFALT